MTIEKINFITNNHMIVIEKDENGDYSKKMYHDFENRKDIYVIKYKKNIRNYV